MNNTPRPGGLGLCAAHRQEWKQSDFAPHNCAFCQAIDAIRSLVVLVERDYLSTEVRAALAKADAVLKGAK